jgi:uncharacterized membrane protein YfcA
VISLILILLLLGSLAGLLAGLLGIGGGLVIVPAMSWFLVDQGVPTDSAISISVATSLASMLLTSASAVLFHARRRVIAGEVIIRLAPSVAIGAVAGALLAVWLGGERLALLFAVIVALIGLRMLLAIEDPARTRAPFPRAWWSIGPLIGAVSAMIGIGGGSFNVPYLRWNGYPMVNAVAMASTCGWLIGLGGALAFALIKVDGEPITGLIGHIHAPSALVIGLAGAVSAPLGVALGHRLPGRQLSRIFGAFLILVAVRMAL